MDEVGQNILVPFQFEVLMQFELEIDLEQFIQAQFEVQMQLELAIESEHDQVLFKVQFWVMVEVSDE